MHINPTCNMSGGTALTGSSRAIKAFDRDYNPTPIEGPPQEDDTGCYQ